ncbi:uncharacterized protein TNIN_401911 [Trichonephila inaurata madagascariensis]|uniref:Uncharacterized protein n=1 Tax=Trichonephila inaurata madagascariensis TaxID=2747483 RepID=A0A8X7CG58_9ARAC|nr:uncharacterized protein TNIN_401911 [Trichonephila inaurata madagascariensis]
MASGQNHSRYDPLLWQATLESFVRHLKHLHSIDEKSLVQKSPRRLTTEALYTIYVMVTFVTLSLLGTLLTLYEHLCKAKENNNNSRKNGIVTCNTTQKKPPVHHFTKGNYNFLQNGELLAGTLPRISQLFLRPHQRKKPPESDLQGGRIRLPPRNSRPEQHLDHIRPC